MRKELYILTVLLLSITRVDAAVFTVSNTHDNGSGSFRQAILDANASEETDHILFAIPGGGQHVIVPATPLPVITGTTLIDGFSQPGTICPGETWPAKIKIVLDGNHLPGNGLEFASSAIYSLVKGLSVVGFGSGPTHAGIWTSAGNMTIAGNLIGLMPDGTAKSNQTGIYLSGADQILIGGSTAESRNVISGNGFDGIKAVPDENNQENLSTGHTISFNFIGTNVYGTAAIGNGQHGIEFEGASFSSISDNVVGGNGQNGIRCGATYAMNPPMIRDVVITRNRIGAGVNNENLGNRTAGILIINARSFLVGSSEANANVVANNGTSHQPGQGGIIVKDYPAGTNQHCSQIQISFNQIFNNNGLGIDLNGDGVTLNDAGDGDTGPNGLLNYPVIDTTYVSDGHLLIEGTLDTEIPNANVSVVFYNNPQGLSTIDPSGYGEAYSRIGQVLVYTDEHGDASFAARYPQANVPDQSLANFGDGIVSETRSAEGDVAEFSKYERVNAEIDSVCLASNPIRSYSTSEAAGANYYEWSVPTGAFIRSGQGSPTITVDWSGTQNGDYFVSVKTINDCGETIEVSTPIRIYQCATDLSITKTGSQNQVMAGNGITYTITIANIAPGAVTAREVSVRDVLPDGLILTGSNPSVGKWTSPEWAIGTLAAGAKATLTLNALVDPGYPGTTISNTAVIASSTPEIEPSNNVATVVTTIDQEADLSITKKCTTDPVLAGRMVDYSLVISNAGPGNAVNVIVNDVVASLLGVEYSTDNVTWLPWANTINLGQLAAGKSANLFLRGLLQSHITGNLINTATVSSSTPDPADGNNSSKVSSAVVTSADLSIQKTCSTSPLKKNEEVVYVITVSNLGPSDALFTSVNDFINPSFISNALFSTDQGNVWMPWSSDLYIGALRAGSTFAFQIKGVVTDNAPASLTNTARVFSGTSDPFAENNQSSVHTPMNQSTDLSLAITGPASVVAGTQMIYTLTILNNDNIFTAQNTILTDFFPASSLSNPKYSIDGGNEWKNWTGSLIVPSLSPNSMVTILIMGTVPANVFEPVFNTATVNSDTPDPNLLNNSVSINTPVVLQADIQIDKKIITSPVVVGQTIEWEIIAKNVGPGDAAGFLITDVLPAGLSAPQYSTDGGSIWNVWPASNQLQFGTLPFTQSVIIRIRSKVNADKFGSISNTVVASSGPTDPNPVNNTASVSTFVGDQTPPEIKCLPDLTVACATEVPDPDTSAVSARDNSGLRPGISFIGDVISQQSCHDRYTITRTYRATDASGNLAECSQIITVNDTIAPEITAPDPLIIKCPSLIPVAALNYNDYLVLAGASLTDNCRDEDILIEHVSDVVFGVVCANRFNVTRIYRASDGCGNFNETSQLITVNDNISPEFTVPADLSIYQGQDYTDLNLTGDVTDETDNCSTSMLNASYSDDLSQLKSDSQAGRIIRTWSLNDGCGNITSHNQTITVLLWPDNEASYETLAATSTDCYISGSILTKATDPDGRIVSAKLYNGQLPDGIDLNTTNGDLFASHPDKLKPGSYSFEILTKDSTGGTTITPFTLILLSDREARYSVLPPLNIDNYLTGDTLALVNDPDGQVVEAVPADESMLPKGTMFNSVDGTITVNDPAKLKPGLFPIIVTTRDESCGLTTSTDTIIIIPDQEAIFTLLPAQKTNEYVNGDSIVVFSDRDGAIVSLILTNGSVLPSGTKFDPITGVISIADASLIRPGTYTIETTTTDTSGGVSTHLMVIVFLPGNQHPVAVNDTIDVQADQPVTIVQLSNDFDPDGMIIPSTVSIIAGPVHGSITVDSLSGEIHYLPENHFYGFDSIAYQVGDNDGLKSNTGLILIRVFPLSGHDSDGDGVTDLQEISDQTNPNDPCNFLIASITLSPSDFWEASDCDSDGVLNKFEIKEGPDTDNDGVPNFLDDDDDGDEVPTREEDTNRNGNFYDDNLNKNSWANYLDPDDDGDGIPTRFEIRDLNSNGIPDYLEIVDILAVDDTTQTGIEIPIGIDVLENDIDIFGFNNFKIVSQPVNGTVLVDIAAGTMTYTPNDEFIGADSLEYAVCNIYDQCDTAMVFIMVYEMIRPPQIFTPNGNGQNDKYVIKNIEKYVNSRFTVFNRWGNKVYESDHYRNDWEGKANVKNVVGNKPLPVGTYFYVLTYGKNRVITGFIYLKR